MNSVKNRLEKIENSINNKNYLTTYFDQYSGETLEVALKRFNKISGNSFTENEVKTKWSNVTVEKVGIVWHHPNFSHSEWVIKHGEKINEKL